MIHGLLFFMRFCWKSSKKYITTLVLGNLLVTIQSLGNIILPKYLLDELIGNQRLEILSLWLAVLIVFNLLCTIISAWMKNASFACRIAVNNSFNEQIGQKMTRLDMEKIESSYYLDLKQKAEKFIYGNMHGFGYVLDSAVIILCRIVSFGGIAAIIFTLSPIVLICFVSLVMICAVVENWAEKRCNEVYLELSNVERREHYLTEVCSSPKYAKEIRIDDLGPWLLEKEKNHHRKMLAAYEKASSFRTISSITGGVSAGIQMGVSYLYLFQQVLSMRISVGSFSMYASAVTSFSQAMRDVMKRLVEIKQFQPYYEAAITFLSMEEGTQQGTESLHEEQNYTIEFRDVSFCYPGQSRCALKEVSFVWHSGERISIVGENGSGKTTIVKLLTRMYKPLNGEITINGVNIQKIKYDEYIRLFSAVFQDFSLFSFTLRDNITNGKEKTDQEVINALSDSGFSVPLQHLPNGLDTYIHKQFSDTGFEPSGGQAQQIALARALLKDAPIIVLDEPSSALDPNAEVNLYNRFNDLVGKKNALFISHRLASCRFCDQILLLKAGEIIEQGTHEELYEKRGEYRHLFDLQADLYLTDWRRE